MPFAREDAGLVPVGDALVLPEQVADLAAAHADVARGDVRVLADVAVELGHERLAEPHDLAVGPPARVEVGAALAAADGHARERVLEDLLEAEELHDAEVDRRVEPQAALVRAERRVELDAEAAVDLHAPGVVHPRDPEDDLALRLTRARGRRPRRSAVLAQHGAERVEDLAHGLVELGLAGVATQDLVVDGLQSAVHGYSSSDAGGTPADGTPVPEAPVTPSHSARTGAGGRRAGSARTTRHPAARGAPATTSVHPLRNPTDPVQFPGRLLYPSRGHERQRQAPARWPATPLSRRGAPGDDQAGPGLPRHRRGRPARQA